MTTKDRTLKVWIELPAPADHEHAIELCTLANKMLERLGVSVGKEGVGGFEWDTKRHQYTYGLASHTYIGLKDRGGWFNLKFLAGESA